jgi:hypothetical protein
MRFTSRAVTVAALALSLSAPALGAAHASGNHWKTLSTIEGGKIQACKVATTKTGPWKIKLRVDATRATSRVSGAAYVMKGTDTKAHWKSGWVAKHHISKAGSVKLPRGKDYTLNAGVGTGAMGNGGTFTARQIRGC